MVNLFLFVGDFFSLVLCRRKFLVLGKLGWMVILKIRKFCFFWIFRDYLFGFGGGF